MALSAFLLHNERQMTTSNLLSSRLPISIQYSRNILVSSSKMSILNNLPGVFPGQSESHMHGPG